MKLNKRIIVTIAAAMVKIAGHAAPVGVGAASGPAEGTTGPVGGTTSGPVGGAEAVAMQLAEALTLESVLKVAVTVIVVEAPAAAPLGTITVSVAVCEAPAARVNELGEILGDHPAPPENPRSNVSVAPPVFVILIV